MQRRQFLKTSACAGAAAAAPGSRFRVIDPHVHVWKHDPKYPWAKETVKPPPADCTPEMLLALMRENGVSRTVIIQVIHYRYDNSYLADVLQQYPREFAGVARVDPLNPAAPDHLSRLIQEQKFQGVRLSPGAGAVGDWIQGPLMPPLWKRCHELKASMNILTNPGRLPDIAKLADRFPGLTIVIDHMADCALDKPEDLAKLLALARFPNLFVKVSHTWGLSRQPYPYPDSQQQVKKLYDQFGPKRLMWGTDWPLVEGFCGYAKALALVRDHMTFLNDEDKRWMLAKTIERVWRFA
ncbi:MAG: amidohydrolase family protein [Acidobacteria bacterium]|nr:amidohydrolase family protein [Acidobacteriota bacterium]